MKLKAKHFAWIYLLKTGGIGEWSFYGSGFDIDKKLTNKAYHDILDYGIDWKKTKEPTDDYESSFVGTECAAGHTKTMDGVLYTVNGNKYNFNCTFENEDIFEVIEWVHGIESIDQFIAEKLLKEL